MSVLLIVPNNEKPQAKEMAQALLANAKAFFETVVVSLDPVEDLSVYQAELTAVLGGDGTVLHAFHRLGDNPPPILGINLGRLGYLAECAPENALAALEKYVQGRLWISERHTVKGEVFSLDGTLLWSSNAVNEILISSAVGGKIAYINVSIDDEFLFRAAGDGLMVSTPTGSTAYAYSAGGPILLPQTNALVLVPVCQHRPYAPPIVTLPESRFTFTPDCSCVVRISADGEKALDRIKEARIEVTGGRKLFRLITLDTPARHRTLLCKLGWHSE